MSNEQSKTQKKLQSRRERARKQRNRKQLMNIGLIVVGALILVGALAYPSLKPVSGLVEPFERTHPLAEFNAMGDSEAPVEIVAYSDFLCIHCSHFYAETEGLLIEDYIAGGQVHYEYRVYIPGTSTDSARAAEAAYCAADQGKFWEMHDALFANYDYGAANGYSNKVLTAVADLAGLDIDEFETCMDANTYQKQVQQDIQQAQDQGVNATPTFFVNGQEIRGAQPYAVFQQAIEEALVAVDR